MTAVLQAEWRKLRSVRSTWLILGTAGLLGIGLGVVAAHSAAPGDDPVGATFSGLDYAQLAFGVLGVLAVSTEYGTGMIRTTLTAMPRRGAVFFAKATLVGGLALLVGEAYAFAAFLAGQATLGTAGLGDPGVLRAVTGAGLYLCAVTLVGCGIGALVRHTAGGIAVMFGLVFLAWPVARAVEKWSRWPDRLVLANAADVLGQVHASGPRLPSLGLAYLDLLLYVVVALGLGVARARQDA